MKTRIVFLACAFLATLVLCGCATTPNQQRLDRIGVEAATVGLIERSSDHAAKAARVLDAVKLVRVQLQDTQTTVGDLRGALLQQLAQRELSPGEKLLALEFIGDLSDGIQQKVGTGLLDAQTIVTVNQVLDTVENTAALYVSQPR